MQIRTVVQEF